MATCWHSVQLHHGLLAAVVSAYGRSDLSRRHHLQRIATTFGTCQRRRHTAHSTRRWRPIISNPNPGGNRNALDSRWCSRSRRYHLSNTDIAVVAHYLGDAHAAANTNAAATSAHCDHYANKHDGATDGNEHAAATAAAYCNANGATTYSDEYTTANKYRAAATTTAATSADGYIRTTAYRD